MLQQLMKTTSCLSHVLQQFDLLHNLAGIPHKLLVKFPESLRANVYLTEHRLVFLDVTKGSFCINTSNFRSFNYTSLITRKFLLAEHS